MLGLPVVFVKHKHTHTKTQEVKDTRRRGRDEKESWREKGDGGVTIGGEEEREEEGERGEEL